MTDYWVSKLFYDLQKPETASEYRADRGPVLARYKLKPEVRAAVLADDVAVLARLVNPYLLRYYFSTIGTPDDVFIRRLREAAPTTKSAKG
jgi:Aromatic-ring-opening dioxygenase LigAB, LigA subunit